jgi:hypothetical protein
MLLRVFPKKVSAALSVFVILASSILWASQAYAQVSGATLTGTVKDSSGAVIPNAQVAITDVATGVTSTVSSGGAGLYTVPNVLPGNYEVRVTATGFSTAVQKGITLTVGAQQVLDFTMQVGQVTQTVEVTTEAPTVELTSSTLSATVNATTVRELPLNGRSWTDLASLQPGVVTAQTHTGDGNRGYGAQVSISGGRPQQNNYRLDGVSINDYTNGGPGSLLGGNLGVDAIQEFSVLTSNYSAEYGKTSGGVVNAISRSGTNQFHGSAYEFLRNSALDARNFFDGPQVPPFKRNQFGASAGAPIRKDRIFIFGDYEAIRQSLGVTNLTTVLSPAARGIDANGQPTVAVANGAPLPGPNQKGAAPNPDPVTHIDMAVVPYLGLEPLPNAGLKSADIGFFRFAGQQVVKENYFTVRVDQKISEKDSLFETYSFDNAPSTQPSAADTIQSRSISRRQIAAVEESHIFSPSFVNTVRIGYNRSHTGGLPSIALNPLAADQSLGWIPGAGVTAPSATMPGVVIAGGGTLPQSVAYYIWNSYQAYDDAFVTKGLHSLKFGVGFERDHLDGVANPEGNGKWSFGTLTKFLTNTPSRFSGGFPSLTTTRGMRVSIVGAYLQDDWRWRPNLTLNLGLRYEMSTVITENRGKISVLYNITDAQPHCGTLVAGCGATGPYFLNPTLRNFEPRVGFSWDPFKNGKTAVRGGFGMFDVLPLLYTTLTLNGRGAPFFALETSSKLGKGTFPSGALPYVSGTGPANLEYEYVEHDPHRNYVMQWNLNVQRQLAPSLTAMVGYVGTRGVHQPFRSDDSNSVLPTQTSAGDLWPNPITPGGTQVNPNLGVIRMLTWSGNSAYDALEVGILKQMSHGLQLQGSYTWGKSIDVNSGVLTGDTLGNGLPSMLWYNLRENRGVSDFNIGRVLVINGSWQIPSIKSASPLAWVANGWQLGGILKVNDGPPFTATFGSDGDPLGLNNQDTIAYPNRLTGPGCATLTNPGSVTNYIKTQCFALPTAPNAAFYNAAPPLGCDSSFGNPALLQCFNLRGSAGRNILRGTGLTNLDFSLFNNNRIKRISENFNAQFRMEVFNILNHANFAPPSPANSDIFQSTGAPFPTAGLLLKTTTTARQIQFALKLTW